MEKSNVRIISNISIERVVEDDSLKTQIDNIYNAMNNLSYREEANIIKDVTLSQIALYMDGLQECSLTDRREKMWGLVRREDGYAIACKCKNTGCRCFSTCRSDLRG